MNDFQVGNYLVYDVPNHPRCLARITYVGPFDIETIESDGTQVGLRRSDNWHFLYNGPLSGLRELYPELLV